MSEATVRASIKTIIEAVSNVGSVYDLEPFASTWDEFLDNFKVTISSVDMIRGFTISCEAIPTAALIATGSRDTGLVDSYGYVIRGYCRVNVSLQSEKNFLVVVQAVRRALDAGIVSGRVYNADPAQLVTYAPRTYGGVLCHYAEIRQIVREQIV